MISVLLADDQDLVRTGLRTLLTSKDDFAVAGEAADGPATVELRPDVILMDVRMPGTDGLEATRRILTREFLTSTRITVLTTFERDAYVFDALRLGAGGFLLKGTPPVTLLDAIRTIADEGVLLSPSVTAP